MWETQVWPLDWEDPLEKRMATHSSILAGKSHGQRSLAWLQSLGSQRVRQDWVTSHTQDSDSNGLKSFIALLFEGQSQGSSSTWALTRNANLRPHSRLISSECTFYQDLQMMCAQLILEISLISHPLARSAFKESNVHTVTYDAIASQSFFLLSSVPQLSYTVKIKWTMEGKNGARSWTVF